MKKILLTAAILMTTSWSQAKTEPLAYMKDVVSNWMIKGTSGQNYKCEFITEWQANGDLKVSVTNQYKTMKPQKFEVVFTAKRAVTEIEQGSDGEIQYSVEQAKTLREDGDYKVQLFESFKMNFINDDLDSVQLQIAEVDFENDPHEDSIYCENIIAHTHQENKLVPGPGFKK